MSPLVNPAALFRLRLSCPRRDRLWPPGNGGLDDACRLPSFAAVVGVPDVLDLWLAWNDGGLAVRAEARGVGNSRNMQQEVGGAAERRVQHQRVVHGVLR